MPIYEYEPTDHDCLMCEGRVAAVQGIDEPPLTYCPDCGLCVRRVVSRASFKVASGRNPEKSGQRGFTTWRRLEEGKWEKVAGPGVDMIVGSPEDVQSIKEEKSKAARPVLDLDAT